MFLSTASLSALSLTNARHAAPTARVASRRHIPSNTALSCDGDRRCAHSPRGGGDLNAASANDAVLRSPGYPRQE